MGLTVDTLPVLAQQMAEILGLDGAPVGVRWVAAADAPPAEAHPLLKHRYCQALMRARRGADVWLDGPNLACPAAAAAFGFRPLPEGLQSGQGLVGFGIVSDPAVGRRMFAEMPRLEPQQLLGIHLFPLTQATRVPDLVVIEDKVEPLMWVVLAYMHATGGARVQSSTAVLQATCVDCAIVPHLEQRLNLTYGCYGCRDATDLQMEEAALGFPAAWLPAIVEHLAFLAEKAIPTSRGKKAWHALSRMPSTTNRETAA
ncbi:MAG: DUF169 domain-containing protein [Anaerolineae bacterium]|nr:DUF169 domain-containing protein [Anaerolineae bacterium]